MREHNHFLSRIKGFTHGLMACYMLLALACNGHAQKMQAGQKGTNWIDWTIEYKGQLSKEEKAKLYDNITGYVKDQLVAQKRPDLAKGLKLNFTESGNSIRVIHDGSTVATGSLVKGPPPPPPPIIPNDKLKTMNPKVNAIKAMH